MVGIRWPERHREATSHPHTYQEPEHRRRVELDRRPQPVVQSGRASAYFAHWTTPEDDPQVVESLPQATRSTIMTTPNRRGREGDHQAEEIHPTNTPTSGQGGWGGSGL